MKYCQLQFPHNPQHSTFINRQFLPTRTNAKFPIDPGNTRADNKALHPALNT